MWSENGEYFTGFFGNVLARTTLMKVLVRKRYVCTYVFSILQLMLPTHET